MVGELISLTIQIENYNIMNFALFWTCQKQDILHPKFPRMENYQITLQIFRQRNSVLWWVIFNSHHYLSTVSPQLEIFDSLLSLKEVHKMFLTNVYLYIPLIINRGFIYFPRVKKHHFLIFYWNIFLLLVLMKLHCFWWRRKWRCQHLMLIQRHPPHVVKVVA